MEILLFPYNKWFLHPIYKTIIGCQVFVSPIFQDHILLVQRFPVMTHSLASQLSQEAHVKVDSAKIKISKEVLCAKPSENRQWFLKRWEWMPFLSKMSSDQNPTSDISWNPVWLIGILLGAFFQDFLGRFFFESFPFWKRWVLGGLVDHPHLVSVNTVTPRLVSALSFPFKWPFHDLCQIGVTVQLPTSPGMILLSGSNFFERKRPLNNVDYQTLCLQKTAPE